KGAIPFVMSLLISTGCGLLYFAIPEWLVGCSLGKFLTRLRVREVATVDRPSLWRSLLRSLVFVVFKDLPSLIVVIILLFAGASIVDEGDARVLWVVASIVFIALLPFLSAGIGMGLLAIPMRRRNGYRGVHELISGTRVIRLPAQRPRFTAP